MEPEQGEPLARTVAVINGKGGVLKTSIVANVGGALARSGLRVLVVDLDLTGNLKLDLGLTAAPGDDEGRSIVEAVWNGSGLQVAAQVRPGLDMVFGGRQLGMLAAMSSSGVAEDLPAAFAARLAELAGDYDLVLIDCPPGNGDLQDMALAAARWVLVPTKTDPGSWDGLRGVGPRVKRARDANPALQYLGVVVTAHNPSATRVLRQTRERLAEAGEKLPLLDATVRHSESAAHDCRYLGRLAHELAGDAAEGRARRLEALSARRAAGTAVELPPALSASADSLAGDYDRLAAEICSRITAHEQSGATA